MQQIMIDISLTSWFTIQLFILKVMKDFFS